MANVVRDKLSRGITSFDGVPVPGSESAEARRQRPDIYFNQDRLVRGSLNKIGHEGKLEEFEEER